MKFSRELQAATPWPGRWAVSEEVTLPFQLVPLIAPGAVLASALPGLAVPGRRPRQVLWLAEAAAGLGVLIALGTAVLLALAGPFDSPLIGMAGVGLSVRLDAVSATMFLLVAFIGWVVVRYSATYLDGEARQGAFTGWLCLTLASVMLLVLSAHLVQLAAAWVATSARRPRSSSPPGWGMRP